MNTSSSTQRRSLSNILVAIDFSSASLTALHYALGIVRRFGATLYLSHVVSNSSDADHAWREGQRLTTDLLISGELRGVPHKLVVGHGEIWEGLSRIVKENHIDMIVVGTHGRTGLAKMLLGSVAERIFRNATAPVLTVGPNSSPRSTGEGGLRRILYATDFTPQSLSAADYAFSLAQQYHSALTLLHVIATEPAQLDARQGAIETTKKRLKKVIPADALLQHEPECVVTFGAAGPGILGLAAKRNPDLIVLGVTQPGEGALAGRRWTNAAEVTGKASCPVLTIRGHAS
jgi:nucleotide-binding universal stress UspA family protein